MNRSRKQGQELEQGSLKHRTLKKGLSKLRLKAHLKWEAFIGYALCGTKPSDLGRNFEGVGRGLLCRNRVSTIISPLTPTRQPGQPLLNHLGPDLNPSCT